MTISSVNSSSIDGDYPSIDYWDNDRDNDGSVLSAKDENSRIQPTILVDLARNLNFRQNSTNSTNYDQHVEGIDDDHCFAYVNFNHELTPLAISSLLLIAGLVYSFFGYRLHKMVLFVSGWTLAFALVFLLCDKERLLPSSWANGGVAAACGVLMGAVTLLVPHAGLFLTGLMAGVPLGAAAAAAWAAGVWANAACLTGIGLLFAVVTLQFQRIMLALNTASLGGVAVALAADYVTHRWQVVSLIHLALEGQQIVWASLCWFDWASLAMWPVIGFLGLFVQLRITAAGFSHKTGWPYYFRPTSTKRRCGASVAGAAVITPLDEEGFGACESYGRRQQETTATKGPQSHFVEPSSFSSLGSRKNGTGPRKVTPKHSREIVAPPSDRTSFTYLYQARRRHGDVICQSYMESLQRLADRRNNSTTKSETNTPTIVSDRTQLTILSACSNSNSGSV